MLKPKEKNTQSCTPVLSSFRFSKYPAACGGAVYSLINRANFSEIRPDKLGRNDPKTTTLYQVKANFDGIRNIVTIFVHDHSDGKRYYDHVTIAKSPVGLTESEQKETDSPTLPYAEDGQNIPQSDNDSTDLIYSIHAEKNTPQRIHVSNQIKKLLTTFEQGDITQEQLTRELANLHGQLESQKDDKALCEAQKGRVRGADYIRQKLLEAKRRGDISDDAADLAEWFILQNESLADDLGISIVGKNQSESTKNSVGYYNPVNRILTLIKGNVKDSTAIHEMLHHLERLMPEDLQAGIRNEWLKQTLTAYKKATGLHADYFEAALSGNQRRALQLLNKIGDKNQKLYRFINASEFWAVNSTEILQNRFHAKSSAIGRVKQWLREFIQYVRKTFGFASHSPLLDTLDYLLNQSNGEKQANRMLSQDKGYFFADRNDDYDFENTKGKPTQEDYLKNRLSYS